MAGTLTISGLATGLISGQNIIGPVSMTGVSTEGERLDVTLVSGDNTIAVPSGAVAALVVISSSNTSELKLRTNLNSGDGGTPLGATGFAVWPLYAGTTSLILYAVAGGGSVEVVFI